MFKNLKNNFKKNFEIFGLVFLIIITAIFTSYFNYKKSINQKTYINLGNIFLRLAENLHLVLTSHEKTLGREHQ